MDKKDEIILQQLDVIRTMTQNNLNRMGSDFWGAPLTPDAPKSAVPKEVAPKANAPKSADGAKPNKSAASIGAGEKKEEEARHRRYKDTFFRVLMLILVLFLVLLALHYFEVIELPWLKGLL